LGAYWRPRDLRAALDILAGEAAEPIAGGTDIMPARANAACWEGASDRPLLDLSAVTGLRGIAREDGRWRIGAGTTWAALRDAALPPGFRALQEAARQVGGRQVQARGTIGGNLCNASPAADGVPPLLVMDAEVEIASPSGLYRLPLAGFILGNRRTALGRGQLLTAILVPAARAAVPSVFLKLGARSHLVISICMVAADAEGHVAVGACSEVARLLDGAALSPITDVRATAAYRGVAAEELVARARARLAA
jgi:CO/xanthine dehydrogenase FAD-binding subunit